jgi:hypothetical protein
VADDVADPGAVVAVIAVAAVADVMAGTVVVVVVSVAVGVEMTIINECLCAMNWR